MPFAKDVESVLFAARQRFPVDGHLLEVESQSAAMTDDSAPVMGSLRKKFMARDGMSHWIYCHIRNVAEKRMESTDPWRSCFLQDFFRRPWRRRAFCRDNWTTG